MFKRLLLTFVFFTTVILLLSCKSNYDSTDEIKLKFSEIDFLNNKLPVINDTSDIVTVREYNNDNFIQILYKKKYDSDSALFSAIIIDGLTYDFGEVDYDVSQYLIDDNRHKVKDVVINEKLSLCKIFVSYGTSAFSDRYFKIVDNVPYVLAEIYGSDDYDLDGDGEKETVSQVGTLPVITIYEWTDDGLLYCDLKELVDNYYGGSYDVDANEIILSRLLNDQVGEQERYKYRDGILYRIR